MSSRSTKVLYVVSVPTGLHMSTLAAARASTAWTVCVWTVAVCPSVACPFVFVACALTGPHRHNWLNADEQGVDARRHVAFRSGSPKNLRAPKEQWSHGFGARPVSDGPYQPVDAADVRRRAAFGARQDDEFADRHCCVHRSRWSVVSWCARATRREQTARDD